MNKWISEYIDEYRRVLAAMPVDQVESLIKKLKKSLDGDSKIFVIGNGGSAANASHFVTDLGKSASDAVGRRFQCMSLNDNVSWMTALGNDYDYEDIYQQQLVNFAKPNDLLIVLSVSGNSPNVVEALKVGNQLNMETFAIVGFDGGVCLDLAQRAIHFPVNDMQLAEDLQLISGHMCMQCLALET